MSSYSTLYSTCSLRKLVNIWLISICLELKSFQKVSFFMKIFFQVIRCHLYGRQMCNNNYRFWLNCDLNSITEIVCFEKWKYVDSHLFKYLSKNKVEQNYFLIRQEIRIVSEKNFNYSPLKFFNIQSQFL